MLKSLNDSLTNSNRIVSFGCSLTYGEELFDSTPDGLNYSNEAYPAIIARYYKCNYISYAKPGYSNDSILRTLHWYLQNECKENDAVLIGWSGIDRIELYNNVTMDYMSLSPGSLESLQRSTKLFNFSSTAEKSFDEIIDIYKVILKYNDDKNTIDTFIRNVFYAQCALQSKNIPCIMVKAMDIDVEIDNENFYSTRSFMEMSSYYNKDHNNMHMKPNGHPNEEMHAAWGNELINWIQQ